MPFGVIPIGGPAQTLEPSRAEGAKSVQLSPRAAPNGKPIEIGGNFRMLAKTGKDGVERLYLQVRAHTTSRTAGGWMTMLIVDGNGALRTRGALTQNVRMSSTKDFEPQDG